MASRNLHKVLSTTKLPPKIQFSCKFCVKYININVLSQLNVMTSLKCIGGHQWRIQGGGCIPPTSLKVRILAEKSASISNNSAPVRDASPPTSLNLTIPAEKSLPILVKTFFFFFFWRPPNFGRKKRLNIRFRPKNHSQFW